MIFVLALLFCSIPNVGYGTVDKFDFHIIVNENDQTYDAESEIVKLALWEDLSSFDPEQQSVIEGFRLQINSLANIHRHSDGEVTSDVVLPAYTFNIRHTPKTFGDFDGSNFDGKSVVLCCPYDFLLHIRYICLLKHAIDSFYRGYPNAIPKTAHCPILSIENSYTDDDDRYWNHQRNTKSLVISDRLKCYPEPNYTPHQLIIDRYSRAFYDTDSSEHLQDVVEQTKINGSSTLKLMKDMDMGTGILYDYINLIESNKIVMPEIKWD